MKERRDNMAKRNVTRSEGKLAQRKLRLAGLSVDIGGVDLETTSRTRTLGLALTPRKLVSSKRVRVCW